jgi:hypothetical protein
VSDLGNIGVVIAGKLNAVNYLFGRFAAAAIIGSGAEAGARVVVFLRSAPVAFARADDAGDWQVNGLDDGTYWVSEIGTPRGWSIVVAGTSVTVTLEEGSGGGGTVVAGYVYAWGG